MTSFQILRYRSTYYISWMLYVFIYIKSFHILYSSIFKYLDSYIRSYSHCLLPHLTDVWSQTWNAQENPGHMQRTRRGHTLDPQRTHTGHTGCTQVRSDYQSNEVKPKQRHGCLTSSPFTVKGLGFRVTLQGAWVIIVVPGGPQQDGAGGELLSVK